jgi:hypothetical protein
MALKYPLYKPFDEARRFVQGLKLETVREYRAWYDRTQPSDLPKHPDVVYRDDWQNWSHFLGNTLLHRLPKHTQVFVVFRRTEQPVRNIVNVAVLSELGSLRTQRILAVFKWNNEKSNQVHTVLDTCSTPYRGARDERITPNVAQLLWDFGLVLDNVDLLRA